MSWEQIFLARVPLPPPRVNVLLVCNSLMLRSFPASAWLTMLSFPGTEFVVVEDVSCFDTNAIILKGTTVLTYKPRFVDRPFSGSLFGIEVRSLRVDQNTQWFGLREKALEENCSSSAFIRGGDWWSWWTLALFFVLSSNLPGYSNV